MLFGCDTHLLFFFDGFRQLHGLHKGLGSVHFCLPLLRTSCEVLLSGSGHSVLPESVFSPLSNLPDSLHGFDGALDELAIVPDRDVSSFFEFESRIDDHLLASSLPKCLGPANLARISLHFEVFMTF